MKYKVSAYNRRTNIFRWTNSKVEVDIQYDNGGITADWLTDERCLALFPAKSEIPNIKNLWHTEARLNLHTVTHKRPIYQITVH